MITIEGKDLEGNKEILLRTDAGRELFKKLDNEGFQIKIKDGDLDDPALGKTLQREEQDCSWSDLSCFSKRFFVKREVFVVTIDVQKINDKIWESAVKARGKYFDIKDRFDKFDAAEVMYHELNAHICLHRKDPKASLNLWEEVLRKEGIKNLTIDEEREFNGHTQEEKEHKLYGSDGSPLSGANHGKGPMKGSPAEEIMEQFNKLR